MESNLSLRTRKAAVLYWNLVVAMAARRHPERADLRLLPGVPAAHLANRDQPHLFVHTHG